MRTSEIRDKFVNYFVSKGHKHLPSASIIPHNDKTLLFTNAGMVQFKDMFTGKANPESKRAVTIQKCVRAGGKHNDLENVGFTSRHHTFFEMIGNFSFGDYFKKEAIAYAWEFLTVELKIPKEKLYVTCHTTDQEAAEIWHTQEGVPKDRIFFLGDKDNFWEMGEVGPCGPCSEIFYDHGPEHSDPKANTGECILNDEDRYVEIWNLVFMQYEKYKEDGEVKRRNLPKPSVDTGAGVERIAAAMQGTYNNFDSDAFTIIMKEIESISQKKYTENPLWMRVIADHARSCTMMLADGVVPSNEGRGYVLRRIIRRAVRHLDLLEVTDISFYKLVQPVFDSLGNQYAENKKNKDFVIKYLRLEEEGFRKTLASGLKLLEKNIKMLKKSNLKVLSGKEAFLLYDTHGFPIDLTEMILKEQGFEIDLTGFTTEMKSQKERSKKAGDFSADVDNSKEFYQIKETKGDSKFDGYNKTQLKATLQGSVKIGDRYALVFDQTPFYAEGGGQEGDAGEIFDGEKLVATISDTKSPVEGINAHISDNNLEIGKSYDLKVNEQKRKYTTYNHTATHLLQAALIEVLGTHIKQSGSSVGPSRLRFDFTHPESVTKDQIVKIERIVNQQIKRSTPVEPEVMSKDKAVAKGATALFGEKYGNEVRVIDIPGFSIELCGGTHVSNTSEIGYFKILTEGSLASGIRRIEACTNIGAFDYIDSKLEVLSQVEQSMNAKDQLLLTKLDQLQKSLTDANKANQALKDQLQTVNAQGMFDGVSEVKGSQVFKYIEASKEDDIRKVGDLFIDKYPNGIVLISSNKGAKVSVLLKTFRNNSEYKCSDILRESMAVFGGKGGGKPDMAQGSVEESNLEQFVKEVTSRII